MKTKKPKQKRKTLRLKIVQHFEMQGDLAYEADIDEAVLSKIINCKRDPTDAQANILSKLLKTHKNTLFRKTEAE